MIKKANKNLILSGFQKSYTDHLSCNLDNINVKLIILNEVKIDKHYDTKVILKKDLRLFDIEKYKFLDNRLFIDDKLFNYYSQYLEDVLMMFSRMDGNKKYINTEMRINFFWELVSVWENFTEENEITTIISREIPHFPAEYILARVAERNNINFLCCEYIEHLNKTMFFNSIDSRTEPVKMKLQNDDTDFSKIILKLSSNYENAKSPWMQKFIFNDSNQKLEEYS